MELIELENVKEEIHQESCPCSVCLRGQKVEIRLEQSDLSLPNCMHDLLRSLPPHFPLHLEQTLICHRREDNSTEYHSYFNPSRDDRRKLSIGHQQLRGLSSLSCQNVQIYFSKTERILARFELISLLAQQAKGERISADGELLYLQPYQPRPIIRIDYSAAQEDKLDSILVEYLEKEEERFKADAFRLNEQFLQWVFREYGEQVFFLFLTALYGRLYRLFTGDTLRSAIFFWTIQPHDSQLVSSQKGSNIGDNYNKMLQLGRPKRLSFKPKLVNLKQLNIYRLEKLFSFHQEYQQLIKTKIDSTTKRSISAIKNKVYRSRLENFRNKLHQVYEKEQETIMAGIQQEKQFEYHHDTEAMARMLIPNMGPYTSLRQILNDEHAFRTVFAAKPLYRHPTYPHPAQQPHPQQTHISQPHYPPLHHPHSPLSKLPKMNHTFKKVSKSSMDKSVEMSPSISATIRKRYQKLLTTPSTHE